VCVWTLRSERTTHIQLKTTPLYGADVPLGRKEEGLAETRHARLAVWCLGEYSVTLGLLQTLNSRRS